MFFFLYFEIRTFQSVWREMKRRTGCDLGRRRGLNFFLFVSDKMNAHVCSTCIHTHICSGSGATASDRL